MHREDDTMDAATALERAGELKATVRRRSRWMVRYQLAYGASTFVSVLLLGLFPNAAGFTISIAFWLAAVVLLSVYAQRQPVAHRGLGHSHAIMIGSWTLVYFAVLFPGVNWFRGDLAWWLPGSFAVAVPPLLMAYLTARRAARP
ncbi:hypothetical protein [Spirillospora sp. NPDC029432]|uniref:hypothetical protein n=1 Tax=Spirillospora sp. NPDC029432 TaxID=3154599 RepID=UPI003451248F